jgi:phosphoribosylanthranilate isomerase
MEPIVQIYEIQTPYDAEPMIELGVDHIGSIILSEDEWKIPAIREITRLVASTESKSSIIPLFSQMDTVFRAIDYYQPNIIHFCEILTDQMKACKHAIQLQEHIKKRFPQVRITRSIPIAQPGKADRFPSLDLARLFEPISDYFLTDTLIVQDEDLVGSQPVSGFVGITGKTCDWELGAELVRTSHIPVILAGGLSPENVSEGIRRVGPAGVDSCTGTNLWDESGNPIRFKKDIEKVRRFIRAVRGVPE